MNSEIALKKHMWKKLFGHFLYKIQVSEIINQKKSK